MYYNLKIDGFKRQFKLNDNFVNLDDNNEIHKYLLKRYRCYVISQKMQNNVHWYKKYTLTKI